MPAIIFLNSCQTRCWRSFSRFSVCRIMNYRSYFIETEDKTVCFSTFCNPFYSLPVYHAIYLEELTAAELTEKIAQLFNISPRQINQIFKQGPTGIHVLVSDEVRSRFFFFLLAAPSKAHRFQPVSTFTLLFTDDSELPGWSLFCIGHNERYPSAALINDDDDLSVSIFNTEPWWTQSSQVYL